MTDYYALEKAIEAAKGHTPGPWRVDGLTIEAPDGNVALVNLARPRLPTDANLRLIALAPDMSDAIRDLRADRDALREAIAEMVEFATSTTAVVEIGRFALDPVKSRADFAAALAAQEPKL